MGPPKSVSHFINVKYLEILAIRQALAAIGGYLLSQRKNAGLNDIIVFGDDFAARVLGRGEVVMSPFALSIQ